MGFNFFKKTGPLTMDLDAGEIYPWRQGTTLKATEKSAFIIPGALFEHGRPISDFIDVSDDNAEIMPVTEQKCGTYPDIAIIINSGVALTLKKNCEVIHIHLKGEDKHKKKFMIKT